MADFITRFKVDSAEYDQKLKKATQALQKYADGCKAAGGTLEYLDEGVLEFTQALGRMNTEAEGTRGKLREMTQSLADLTAIYRGLTDEEKKSPFGRELAGAIEQLTKKAGEARDAMDDVQASVKHAASDTRVFDSLAQGASLATSGFQTLQGAGKMLGIEMGDNVEVIARLQAAMAVTNGLTQIQTALQKQSAVMMGITALQAKAAAVSQSLMAKNTALATVAQKAFNIVANANPYVLLASAIGAVVGALALFCGGSDEAEKKEEELEKQAEETAKRLDEMRDTIVNASVEMMSSASKVSRLQAAYKNANDEISKTEILRQAQTEFKKLGIECNNLGDAQTLLVEKGTTIIQLMQLQGKAAALAALRMEAYKKSFKMLLERGYDVSGAAGLATYNGQVQEIDAELLKINTQISGLRSQLPMGGSRGGGGSSSMGSASSSTLKFPTMLGGSAGYDASAYGYTTPAAPTPYESYLYGLTRRGEAAMAGVYGPITPLDFPTEGQDFKESKGYNQYRQQESTKKFKASLDKTVSKLEDIAAPMSNIAQGLENLGVELPEGVSKLLNGMEGIISIMQGVSQLLSLLGPAIAANTAAQSADTATNLASAAGTIAVVAAAASKGGMAWKGGIVRASGGYEVPGNFGFDTVPALLKSGEVVLNRAQQGNLASQLLRNAAQPVPHAVVSGEDILIALNNYGRKRGYGDVVMSR